MQDLIDGSIDMMVTSPPYWDIKNYFKKGQIGQESYKEYQIRISKVWKECYKKLNDFGTMWINVNTIFKNRKLVPIPGDIIKNCKEIGFKFKACIIWHKSSAIPTGPNNLCDHFEYFFIFSKTNKLYLNCKNLDQINDYSNKDFLNGSFWNINRKAGIIGKNYIHPAVFPLELIKRSVSISTNENDLVLDPFLGSGTTLLAALNTGRSFVGYEFYEGFKDVIEFRIKNESIKTTLTKFHLLDKTDVKHKIFRN